MKGQNPLQPSNDQVKTQNHKLHVFIFPENKKLIKRNHIIVNGCPVWLKDAEMAHHITIHCDFACIVWYSVINLSDMEWVKPRSVEDLFIQRQLGCSW